MKRNSDRVYAHAWKCIPDLSNNALLKLATYFKTMEAAWAASFYLLKKTGIHKNTLEKILNHKNTITPKKNWEQLKKTEIKMITIRDAEYPTQLKKIYDPPYVLYYRGNISLLKEKKLLAVVGSRNESLYGKTIIEHFIPDFVKNDICITSGLALGCDGHAHAATLKHHGKTIAVLGSGIDDVSIAPPSHIPLAKNIIKHAGLILSEYLPGTQALPYYFPARNRIIAGISQAICVVEASEKSGALITAKLGLEYGRDIWACPGNIFSDNTKGTHMLIDNGASLAFSSSDIIHALCNNMQCEKKSRENEQRSLEISPEETAILQYIHTKPIHIDAIAEYMRIPTQKLNACLAGMELKGIIKTAGAMCYQRIKSS